MQDSNETQPAKKLNIAPVVKYFGSGVKTLKTISAPVEIFDANLKTTVELLANTVYFYNAVGISGIQIGVPERIVVVRMTKDGYTPFINPQILEIGDIDTAGNEGCLSFPGIQIPVKRSDRIKISYQTMEGKEETAELFGLHSRCVQHEIDHLNGKTFLDALSNLKQDIVLKKLKKSSKRGTLDYDLQVINHLSNQLINNDTDPVTN